MDSLGAGQYLPPPAGGGGEPQHGDGSLPEGTDGHTHCGTRVEGVLGWGDLRDVEVT